MNLVTGHLVLNKRKLLFLLIFLCFVTGLLLAYQPVLSIICFLLIALSILLPFTWLTWLVIAMAPLQWYIITLENIPYIENIPYKISYFDIVVLVLVANFVWNGVLKKVWLSERHLLCVLALFCLVGLVSLLKAAYPLSGVNYLLRLGAVLIVFFSVICFVQEQSFEYFLSALFVCLWLVGIVGFINTLQWPEAIPSTVKVLFEEPGSVVRLESIYNQPNITSHTIGVFLPILVGLSLIRNGEWITQVLLIITAFFLGFLLILTGSRGGVITATIGLFIFTLYMGRFSLLFITLILVGIIVFNWPLVMQFLFDVRPLSLNNRIDLIYYGLQTVAEHPILGIGLGQFKTHFHSMPFYLAGRSSHNAYLEVLVEMGMLGFGIFITFIIFIWKKITNATDQKARSSRLIWGIALSSFASLLCSKLFMGGLLLATWWIALAIIIGFTERLHHSDFQRFYISC